MNRNIIWNSLDFFCIIMNAFPVKFDHECLFAKKKDYLLSKNKILLTPKFNFFMLYVFVDKINSQSDSV